MILSIGIALLVSWGLVRGLASPGGRKVLGWAALVIGVLGVLGGLFFTGIFIARPVSVPQPTVPAQSLLSGPMWAEGIEEEFAAAVYSSAEAAAYGLGRRLELDSVPGEILLAGGSAPMGLVTEVRRGLQSRFEGADVYINAMPGRVPQENQIYISLTQEETKGRKISGPHVDVVLMQQGTLEATIHTMKGKYVHNVVIKLEITLDNNLCLFII